MRRPRHEIIDRNAIRLQRLRHLALQINHQQALTLPGVDKADLEIQAKDNAIRSSGRKNIAYPEGVSVHRRECLTGTFDRTLTVPMQINADGIANIATACWRSSYPRAAARAKGQSQRSLTARLLRLLGVQRFQYFDQSATRPTGSGNPAFSQLAAPPGKGTKVTPMRWKSA